MEGLRRGGRSEGEEAGSKSGESYGAAVRWSVVNERCESLDWGVLTKRVLVRHGGNGL